MRGIAKAALAVVIGMAAAPYLIWCWAQIAGHGLLFDPLFSVGLRENALYAALAAADLLGSLILLLPAALALLALGRPRATSHTCLALLALFAASSALVGLPGWPEDWRSLVGNLSPYIALSAGVWLCLLFAGRTPNNSFKPNPLRGSA